VVSRKGKPRKSRFASAPFLAPCLIHRQPHRSTGMYIFQPFFDFLAEHRAISQEGILDVLL
ncbi:MAG TPA: hypothetical protein VIJ87_02135, partial [Pyrinomonadaceae bacterium]